MKIKSVAILFLVMTLFSGCKKDGPDESNYLTVKEGPWEFRLTYMGMTVLNFSGGSINQQCTYLYFDTDKYFEGYLDGRTWSGENSLQQFRFTGSFTGTPADAFTGTLTFTDGSNKAVDMIGKYGKLQ